MLDQDTKRKIDSARDILVGKVPDPKAQVEQITIALIYKFMDDMDKESIELGGKARFFTADYEKYNWSNLMDSRMGGFDRLNIYSEALIKMSQNPKLPQLFRDIFNGAFLPYRDPETLNLFLKEINTFSYDHSERLGDAFEYLLSVLGSQGEAGQFRTPRHIIDFIVSVIDPKKDETILDPACGTAGFLISAYKHILNQNKQKHPGDKLTPEEKSRIMGYCVGYDISPDMVRLSRVNMYLHNFPTPRIFEYDTLTSEEKWGESYDIILANPPFMTPKGGIRPHKRFSVQANRSEVLFVDYIAEHLNVHGRAGVIVPEGIIFQSANAYKALRKMLVDENYLFAVVSLPAGVFNPYSGVKTSILLMDKTLAKKTKNILFVKVENDGFDLGAQRRPIKENDFPEAFRAIIAYKEALISGECFKEDAWQKVRVVDKSKIAQDSEYGLSGERYGADKVYVDAKWPIVGLRGLIELIRGVTYSKNDEVSSNGHEILRANNISLSGGVVFDDIKLISRKLKLKETQKLKAKDIFICLASGSKEHIGKAAYINRDTNYYFGGFMGVIRTKNEAVKPLYLFHLLRSYKFNEYLRQAISGTNINNLNAGILNKYRIPLPPLKIQEKIVAELDGYQKIITGAKQIIENYKPIINIDPSWEKVELGEVADVISGQSPEGKYYNEDSKGMAFYQGKTEFADINIGEPKKWTTRVTKEAEKDDVLMSVRAPVGPVNLSTQKICIGRGLSAIRTNGRINQMFLFYYLKSIENLIYGGGGSVFDSITREQIKRISIPCPQLDVQRKIVKDIKEECKIIEENKKLIEIFEAKTKDKISEVWGDKEEAR